MTILLKHVETMQPGRGLHDEGSDTVDTASSTAVQHSGKCAFLSYDIEGYDSL